jgi:hypothetical protein
VDAFKLRYTLTRERVSAFDQALRDIAPPPDGRFHYALTRWELIPILPRRGESLREALRAGSRFRQVIDGLDPDQATLTFFIYPDSFELFRALRDELYEIGFVVAGRPLPASQHIFGSRTGSISRGQ